MKQLSRKAPCMMFVMPLLHIFLPFRLSRQGFSLALPFRLHMTRP